MYRFEFAAVALLVCGTVQAQPPQDMLAGRVSALEERVKALESRLGPSPVMRATPREPGKRSYADGYAQSLATGLPLLVWAGTAICPPCVQSTDGTEFINVVGDVPGCAPNAITVGVPQGGEIVKVGEVTSWVTGSPTLGHVPSSRRLLAQHRGQPVATPYMATSMTMGSMAGNCATCTSSAGMMMQGGMMGGYSSAPMHVGMMQGGGLFRRGAGRGCASCGG